MVDGVWMPGGIEGLVEVGPGSIKGEPSAVGPQRRFSPASAVAVAVAVGAAPDAISPDFSYNPATVSRSSK